MDDTLQKIDPQSFDHSGLALNIQVYRSGDEIVSEGKDNAFFYVILTGQVRITQRGKRIRLLEPNDVFGLEGALLKKPSLYSARPMDKARIATYGPEALDLFFRDYPRMTESILLSTVMQLMQTTHNLSREVGAFAIEDVRVRFYGDGQVILEEGTTGTQFFRLVSSQGGLRVTMGEEEISHIQEPGEFFGELAALLELPRQATVTSIGESVVQMYDSQDLGDIVNDYPEIALQIMRSLMARLKDTDHCDAGTCI